MEGEIQFKEEDINEEAYGNHFRRHLRTYSISYIFVLHLLSVFVLYMFGYKGSLFEGPFFVGYKNFIGKIVAFELGFFLEISGKRYDRLLRPLLMGFLIMVILIIMDSIAILGFPVIFPFVLFFIFLGVFAGNIIKYKININISKFIIPGLLLVFIINVFVIYRLLN